MTGERKPENPFKSPSLDAGKTTSGIERRQSGMGIASFVIAIGAGVTLFVLLMILGAMDVSTPGGIDEESPEAIIAGLGLLAVVAINILGIGLAVGGLVQTDRLRMFGVLGLVFNLLVILGFVGIMVIGSLMM